MTSAELGTELSFLARCSQWNFATFVVPSRPEIPPNLNWARFVALARYHRMQGLAWNALAPFAHLLPDEASEALASDARAIAATNLAIAGECRELHDDFQAEDIPLLFFKGLTIGALAYRSPMLKMGRDIDLLIDPLDLDVAAKLLARRGYGLCLPVAPARLQSWHRRSKESVWSRGEGLLVELHTRMADNQRLIPGLDVHAPRQLVEVAPTVPLPTLGEEELFAYLAVHGASSAWFRLKWISDFAGLLHGKSGEEVMRLYDRSQELGAGRAAGQALLLADALFDVLEPAAQLREQFLSDRMTRLLYSAALRILIKALEPTEQPMGTLTIHWTQLLLRPGLAYKVREIWRQAGMVVMRYQH